MICTLWTPFQAERDWTNSYREILLIPLYIFYSLWLQPWFRGSILYQIIQFETFLIILQVLQHFCKNVILYQVIHPVIHPSRYSSRHPSHHPSHHDHPVIHPVIPAILPVKMSRAVCKPPPRVYTSSFPSSVCPPSSSFVLNCCIVLNCCVRAC